MIKKELVFVMSLMAIMAVATGVASADPGISVDVIPVKDTVLPGETAIYTVSVYCFAGPGVTERVKLDISNPTPGWTYTFDPEEFYIDDKETVHSSLTMDVPGDESIGEYYHDVHAIATFMGWVIEETTYTNVLTTLIPEFTTIAIPVVALLGLFAFYRRKQKK